MQEMDGYIVLKVQGRVKMVLFFSTVILQSYPTVIFQSTCLSRFLLFFAVSLLISTTPSARDDHDPHVPGSGSKDMGALHGQYCPV